MIILWDKVAMGGGYESAHCCVRISFDATLSIHDQGFRLVVISL